MAIQPFQRPPQQGAAPQGMPQPMGGGMPQPQPQQIAQPQGGIPPQMQGAEAMPSMPPQNGEQMPNNMDFESMSPAEQEQIVSQIVGVVLAQRISKMSDEELHELDEIITPESITILAKLLPEMIPVFENASSISGNNNLEAEEGYSEDGEEEDGMNKNPLTEDDSEDEESQMMNRNPAVSQGLVR